MFVESVKPVKSAKSVESAESAESAESGVLPMDVLVHSVNALYNSVCMYTGSCK